MSLIHIRPNVYTGLAENVHTERNAAMAWDIFTNYARKSEQAKRGLLKNTRSCCCCYTLCFSSSCWESCLSIPTPDPCFSHSVFNPLYPVFIDPGDLLGVLAGKWCALCISLQLPRPSQKWNLPTTPKKITTSNSLGFFSLRFTFRILLWLHSEKLLFCCLPNKTQNRF
jgi:hypothetical protein